MNAEERKIEKEATIRKQFLCKVAAFVESITKERGEVLRQTVGRGRTHKIIQLHNYGGFSFHFETDKDGGGSNEIKVWYRPIAHHGIVLSPVLHISWRHSVDDCTIVAFEESVYWQRAILKVIQRRKGISARLDHQAAIAARNARVRARKEITWDKRSRIAQQCAA